MKIYLNQGKCVARVSQLQDTSYQIDIHSEKCAVLSCAQNARHINVAERQHESRVMQRGSNQTQAIMQTKTESQGPVIMGSESCQSRPPL
jgi:hypothetical protein